MRLLITLYWGYSVHVHLHGRHNMYMYSTHHLYIHSVLCILAYNALHIKYISSGHILWWGYMVVIVVQCTCIWFWSFMYVYVLPLMYICTCVFTLYYISGAPMVSRLIAIWLWCCAVHDIVGTCTYICSVCVGNVYSWLGKMISLILCSIPD